MALFAKRKPRRAMATSPRAVASPIGIRAVPRSTSVASVSRQGLAALAISSLSLVAATGWGVSASAASPMATETAITGSLLFAVADDGKAVLSDPEAPGNTVPRMDMSAAAAKTTTTRLAVLNAQAVEIAEASTQAMVDSGNVSPDTSGFYALPALGRVSSDFGWRSMGFHQGIDIAADCGNPVWVGEAGTVIRAGYKALSGISVDVQHTDGSVTKYYHLTSFSVSEGQHISRGQKIGLIGDTGHSTGCHLHFQVEIGGLPVDPAPYLHGLVY